MMPGIDDRDFVPLRIDHGQDERHEAVVPAATAEAGVDVFHRHGWVRLTGQAIAHLAGQLGHQQGG